MKSGNEEGLKKGGPKKKQGFRNNIDWV